MIQLSPRVSSPNTASLQTKLLVSLVLFVGYQEHPQLFCATFYEMIHAEDWMVGDRQTDRQTRYGSQEEGKLGESSIR